METFNVHAHEDWLIGESTEQSPNKGKTLIEESVRYKRHNPNTRLSEDTVREIRRNDEQLGYRLIAKKFKVSVGTAADIMKGRTWQHVA